jgi:hypothetical protein
LQTSTSLQDWPLGTAAKTHPVAGVQLSLVHGFESSHGSGSLTQAWPTQRSLVVQALTSAQSASDVQHAASGVWPQPVCALQVSVVQLLPSLQFSAPPGVQAPP